MNNNDQQIIQEKKIADLANQLSELTFNEQLALVTVLEKECGFILPAGGLDNNSGAEDANSVAEEQPTAFKVNLNKIPTDTPTKFALAKFLSTVMGIDLVGARNALSKLPITVKENLTAEETTKLLEDLKKISSEIEVEKL